MIILYETIKNEDKNKLKSEKQKFLIKRLIQSHMLNHIKMEIRKLITHILKKYQKYNKMKLSLVFLNLFIGAVSWLILLLF